MSSASRYTNRLRVLAEASVKKVQYPGNVATVNPLLPAINCKPSFSVLQYPLKPSCPCPVNPKPIPFDYTNYYLGGDAFTNSPFFINGGMAGDFYYFCGNAFTNSTNVIFGGVAGVQYVGGDAFSNPTQSIYAGDAEVHADYSGGNAFTNPTTGITGGRASFGYDYSGGNAFTDPRSSISGGTAGDPYYSGGSAFSTALEVRISGGDSGVNEPILRGGNAFAKPDKYMVGGNTTGELYLEGGNAFSVSAPGQRQKLKVVSGGAAFPDINYSGGNAFSNPSSIVWGGLSGATDIAYRGGDALTGALPGQPETMTIVSGGDAGERIKPLFTTDAFTDNGLILSGGAAGEPLADILARKALGLPDPIRYPGDPYYISDFVIYGGDAGKLFIPPFNAGGAFTKTPYIVNGGDANDAPTSVFSGGTALFTYDMPVVDIGGGDAFTDTERIVSGGNSGIFDYLQAGNAFAKPTNFIVNGPKGGSKDDVVLINGEITGSPYFILYTGGNAHSNPSRGISGGDWLTGEPRPLGDYVIGGVGRFMGIPVITVSGGDSLSGEPRPLGDYVIGGIAEMSMPAITISGGDWLTGEPRPLGDYVIGGVGRFMGIPVITVSGGGAWDRAYINIINEGYQYGGTALTLALIGVSGYDAGNHFDVMGGDAFSNPRIIAVGADANDGYVLGANAYIKPVRFLVGGNALSNPYPYPYP